MSGKSNLTVIKKQSDWGIYVWVTPEGGVLVNSNGDCLNIPARKGDIYAMNRIRQAAAHYGHTEGFPEFMAGVRRVTDEEHSEMLDRMKQGLIPSETDIGAWIDAKKGFDTHGGD